MVHLERAQRRGRSGSSRGPAADERDVQEIDLRAYVSHRGPAPSALAQAAGLLRLQHLSGNQAVQHLVQAQRAGLLLVQRVFSAQNPATYDDDGGHGLERHGPAVTEDAHKARAQTNDPTYSSSGWASQEMMKKAVVAAHAALRTWPNNKTTKGKFKAKFTANVNLAGAGFTWVYDDATKATTKVVSNTGVVIFSINPNTGAVIKMTTAFPGAHAKDGDMVVAG